MKSAVYNAARGDILILTGDASSLEAWTQSLRTAYAIQENMGPDAKVVMVPETASVVSRPENFWTRWPQDGQWFRAVAVQVRWHDFIELFSQHRREAKTGLHYVTNYPQLPDDVRLDGIIFDRFDMLVRLRFSHPSFPEIIEGMPLPDFDIGSDGLRLKSFLHRIVPLEESSDDPEYVDG